MLIFAMYCNSRAKIIQHGALRYIVHTYILLQLLYIRTCRPPWSRKDAWNRRWWRTRARYREINASVSLSKLRLHTQRVISRGKKKWHNFGFPPLLLLVPFLKRLSIWIVILGWWNERGWETKVLQSGIVCLCCKLGYQKIIIIIC